MGRYFALMGCCLGLLVLAWIVIRPYSTAWSVALSAVAAVIPPIAAIVANWNTGFGPPPDARPPQPPEQRRPDDE
jgi:hypothetical protein